jgi:hypothetical protein
MKTDEESQGVPSCLTAYAKSRKTSKFCHDLQLDVFDQIIPFSVISQVLSTCDAWEKRERNLNMVAVIWTIIAMGLLPNLSIPHVLQKMAQGLRYIWPDPDIGLPTASALAYRRQQLGVQPQRQLFEQICQPRSTLQTPGAFRFGLRLMAMDSTLENVPNSFANDLTDTASQQPTRFRFLASSARRLSARVWHSPHR